jgi:hypothetical protein
MKKGTGGRAFEREEKEQIVLLPAAKRPSPKNLLAAVHEHYLRLMFFAPHQKLAAV